MSRLLQKEYRNCPIMFPNRISYNDLVEHDMLYFDVILGMDWLHARFSSIEFRTKVVKFTFPNVLVLE